MKKSSVLGGLAFAAILGSVFTFPVYAKEKTFPEGIYAGGFALGGLTKEQAETQFAAYISGLEERSVTLDVAGNGLETTAKDLGYACKNEAGSRGVRRRRLSDPAVHGAQGSGKGAGAYFAGCRCR